MRILSCSRDSYDRFYNDKQEIDTFFTCRLKTSDDWYPNFDKNEVVVTIMGWSENYIQEESEKHIMLSEPAYRICIWGKDDFGLEKDFYFEDTTPTELFRYVLSWPEPITKEWLRKEGFYNA